MGKKGQGSGGEGKHLEKGERIDNGAGGGRAAASPLQRHAVPRRGQPRRWRPSSRSGSGSGSGRAPPSPPPHNSPRRAWSLPRRFGRGPTAPTGVHPAAPHPRVGQPCRRRPSSCYPVVHSCRLGPLSRAPPGGRCRRRGTTATARWRRRDREEPEKKGGTRVPRGEGGGRLSANSYLVGPRGGGGPKRVVETAEYNNKNDKPQPLKAASTVCPRRRVGGTARGS